MIHKRDENGQRTIICPLCKLPFETGDVGHFVDGKVYHPGCLTLNEKLTNSKGQLGEKSLMSRFVAAKKKPKVEPPRLPPTDEQLKFLRG
jgi:hypothetical protein